MSRSLASGETDRKILNHPGTPHVHLLTILSPHQNLRRHVVRRPHHPTHPHILLVPSEPLGRPEIRELNPPARIEQNVIRFYVPVGDPGHVATPDGRHELPENDGGGRLRQRAPRRDPLVEVAAAAEVGDDVEVTVALVHFEEVKDVWAPGEELEDLGLFV
nr:DGCR13 [Ipomoea batatas]